MVLVNGETLSAVIHTTKSANIHTASLIRMPNDILEPSARTHMTIAEQNPSLRSPNSIPLACGSTMGREFTSLKK
jgi:hypothetical protein